MFVIRERLYAHPVYLFHNFYIRTEVVTTTVSLHMFVDEASGLNS